MVKETDHEPVPDGTTTQWRTVAPLKLWEMIRNGEFKQKEIDEFGEIALKELRYDVAEVFLAASGLKRKDHSFVLRLARTYESFGDFKRAIKILDYGVELKVPIPEVYLRLGKLYMRQKDYEKSLAVFELACRLFPDIVDDPDYQDSVERARTKIALKEKVSTKMSGETLKEEPCVSQTLQTLIMDGSELRDSGTQETEEMTLLKWLDSVKKHNLAAYLECYHPEARLYKENTFEDLGHLYAKVRAFDMAGPDTPGTPATGARRVSWLAADRSIHKWVYFRFEDAVTYIEFMEHLSDSDLAGI